MRGEPHVSLQSMHELVRDAYDAVSAAGLTGVEASFRLDAPDDRVLADKIQIQQVLVNLVRNAIEAMSEAPEAEAHSGDINDRCKHGPNRCVRHRIGPVGANPRNSVRTLQNDKGNGMGVGLSISRSIIEAHHGRLWAETNPEGGAIFSFTLPLADFKRAI
ncbi:ATP-binding protein [Methylocystis sp. Sn-Cys]|uniref:ATP-binding protein n=1 Tax=Methylocystis sp. Sn-Cys TaxID=1701263 RepID=UPI0019219CB0|nr:ATP-binding protein [Methylocystis sp. Sn-Cys]MBL1258832.1 hypothetical protein [Methylocystis sp. Sn-Cys]